MADIYDSARQLGRALCGKVPYVTGTTVRKIPGARFSTPKIIVQVVTSNVRELQKILPRIPIQFDSFEIYIEISTPPKFGGRKT